MNILYICHEYHERRKKYAKELANLGHNVRVFDVKKKTKKRHLSKDLLKGMDQVWTLTYLYVHYKAMDRDFIKAIKKKNIPLITYTTLSTGVPTERVIECCDPFDYVFLHCEWFTSLIREKSGSDKFRHMPFGFYKEDYFPLKKKETIDISFTGNPQTGLKNKKHDQRVRFLKKLAKVFNIKVYGKKLCTRMGCRIRPFSTHKEQRKIYANTKVNLDLPFMNSTIPGFRGKFHPKNRIFEIPACKRILLEGYDSEFIKLLEPNKEAFYYTDIDDCIDKAKYILSNYDKLNHVRKAGYERVKAEHQFKHRFQKMMEIIKG